MARRRFRRKDLKRPDEFVTRGQQLLLWSQAHLRLLGWILGGGTAVAVLVVGFLCGRYARLIGPKLGLLLSGISLLYFSLRLNASPWEYVAKMPDGLFVDVLSLAERVDRVYRTF